MRGSRTRAAALASIVVLVPSTGGCGEDGERMAQRHDAGREQPYAGLEKREIRALPPDRVRDLLGGQGAGYALAAELNHYPGPAHVLELGEKLGLSREQARAMRRIEAEVHAKAKPLGRRIVELEKELDRAFRSGTVSSGEVARLTAEIAELEARLRFTHLEGHLETRKLLTRHQVARYDELRGYGHGHEQQEEHQAPG